MGVEEKPAEPERPAEAQTEEAQTEPQTEPEVLPLGALATREILVGVLSLLAAKAWEGMGLVPNPATNKVQKDLDGARLAIDAYGALFEVIREHIEHQPRREMESLLTTLRINFVEKSGGG